MKKKYYVQEIAENYLRNVIDDPIAMKVHDRFLNGLDHEQFQEGFLALTALIRSLYRDIADAPESFGMLLKENKEYNPKNADYTNSNMSFTRVPNLLLVLGAHGVLQPDLTLTISGEALELTAKELKIAALPMLLSRLEDYGFEISGLQKTVKTSYSITLTYIDNRVLTAVLKAMADAMLELNKGNFRQSKNYFYMMHPEILENEKVREPKLTVESIYHAVDAQKGEIAAALHETVADVTKQALRMGGFMRNDWSCIYTGKKSKKVLMSFRVEQEEFSVKLNLQNIGKFIPVVKEQPGKIQEAVRSSGWDCRRCNSGCAGGFAFEMDGMAYSKCRCGSFVFENLTMEDTESCQKLLAQELSCEE